MGTARSLPSGITFVENLYRFDFRWKNKRYRLRTTISKESEAIKVYNALRYSLDNNQFEVANFENKIPNVAVLLGINVGSMNMTDLLMAQIEKYRSRQDLVYSSFYNLKGAIELHLLPYFKNINIATISINDIEDFIKSLKFSRDRIRLIIRPLRQVFREAIRDGIIKENPFSLYDNSILNQHAVNTDYEVKPFSLDEINRILTACKHQTVKNLIATGFYTGMRLGELMALTWDDINFINETISVDKTVSFGGIIKQPKTKAGIRVVEMLPEAKLALLAQQEITGDAKNGRVFKGPQGKNYTKTDTLGRHWRNALTTANVEYRNPYQMRHTFISMMLSRGNSPLVLYRMIGHETTEIMYKHYARYINNNENKKLLI